MSSWPACGRAPRRDSPTVTSASAGERRRARIGAVADHVPEADHRLDPLGTNVGEDRIERGPCSSAGRRFRRRLSSSGAESCSLATRACQEHRPAARWTGRSSVPARPRRAPFGGRRRWRLRRGSVGRAERTCPPPPKPAASRWTSKGPLERAELAERGLDGAQEQHHLDRFHCAEHVEHPVTVHVERRPVRLGQEIDHGERTVRVVGGPRERCAERPRRRAILTLEEVPVDGRRLDAPLHQLRREEQRLRVRVRVLELQPCRSRAW